MYEIIVCPATKDNPRNSEADIIELKNRNLLLAYTDFYAGSSSDFSPARISGKISEDKGRSWSDSLCYGCIFITIKFRRNSSFLWV